MDTGVSRDPSAAPVPASGPEAAGRSPLARATAIFVRPGNAWVGLRERAQWWFPFLLVLAVTLAGSVLLYRRAQLPAMMDAMEEQVANGPMTADQMQRIEDFYGGPAGPAVTVRAGAGLVALLTLPVALLRWVG